MPYKEMAGNCEALSEEKQQKITNFIASQPTNESSVRTPTHDDDNLGKEPSQRHVQFTVNKVLFIIYSASDQINTSIFTCFHRLISAHVCVNISTFSHGYIFLVKSDHEIR